MRWSHMSIISGSYLYRHTISISMMAIASVTCIWVRAHLILFPCERCDTSIDRYSFFLQTTLTCIYVFVWCKCVFVKYIVYVPPPSLGVAKLSNRKYIYINIYFLTTIRIRHLPLGSCHYFLLSACDRFT